MTLTTDNETAGSKIGELERVVPMWARKPDFDALVTRSDSPRITNFANIAEVSPAHVRHQVREEVDLARATLAVGDLLGALGIDASNESLAETPARVARAYVELLSAEPFEATTFPNDEGYDGLVVVKDVEFTSLCEHHLLPFRGVAHVGYLPGDRLVGLSKLARAVTYFSRRLQVQERLTNQVADWLVATLQPHGVGVVIEAEHACISVRGVHATGSKTLTSSLAGRMRDDASTRREFFSMIECRP